MNIRKQRKKAHRRVVRWMKTPESPIESIRKNTWFRAEEWLNKGKR